MVAGEVLEEHRRLLGQRRIRLDAAERREWRMDGRLRQRQRGRRRIASGATPRMKLAASTKSSSEGVHRSCTAGLLREALDGLAMLVGEALGERKVLGAPLYARVVGQARAETPDVLVVEAVALV